MHRQIDKNIKFIVVGDRKTPKAAQKFIENLGNAVYYSAKDQEQLNYKCSEIIGWNKIMRRNIALLEAIKEGSDIIISVDDDNIPINKNYFNDFVSVITNPYTGLKITSDTGWFNVGDFMLPKIYHRGFPYPLRHKNTNYHIAPITNTKIGIAAGMWFGDPDIDAMDRITNRPVIYQCSELLHNGIVLDNTHIAPIDSQNTAFITELAPLMMVLTGVGRYDDIWASYIAQRVMSTTNYHCHFGKPFVWQERNPHNLWNNLKDELFGMEHTPKFCEVLSTTDIGEGTILDKLECLYNHLKEKKYLPPIIYKLGKAWCADVKSIL